MTYKLFTTPKCGYCPGVKQYLKSKGKEFTEVDATPFEVMKEIHAKYNAMTVPILVREDGEYVVGPNFGKISAIM